MCERAGPRRPAAAERQAAAAERQRLRRRSDGLRRRSDGLRRRRDRLRPRRDRLRGDERQRRDDRCPHVWRRVDRRGRTGKWPQRGQHVGRISEPIFGSLGQRRAQHRRHAGVHVVRELFQARGRLLEVLSEVVGEGRSLERRPPRQHHEQRDAQRIQVGSTVERLAAQLLGGHIGGRADQAAGTRQRRQLDVFGDAEVHDLQPPTRRDHQIRGLDVAVHDAARPRRVESFEHLAAHVGGARRRVAPLALQPVGDGQPLDPLHDDEGHSLQVASLVEQADDVRIGQAAHRGSFLLEALDDAWLGLQMWMQTLDGDRYVGGRVATVVDAGETARGDRLVNAVLADLAAKCLLGHYQRPTLAGAFAQKVDPPGRVPTTWWSLRRARAGRTCTPAGRLGCDRQAAAS